MAKKTKPAAGITGKLNVAKTPSAAAGSMDDYQTQDDMRTLMRAHEIKSDPKRHAKAKAHAKAQLGKMKAVATGSNGDSTVGPMNKDAQGNMGV
jgi:hypothetical protein